MYLVSTCYTHMVPAMWLKTTQMYYLAVLRSGIWNGFTGCREGLHFSLEALGKHLLPCLFQLLEATCIHWLLIPSYVFIYVFTFGCISKLVGVSSWPGMNSHPAARAQNLNHWTREVPFPMTKASNIVSSRLQWLLSCPALIRIFCLHYAHPDNPE